MRHFRRIGLARVSSPLLGQTPIRDVGQALLFRREGFAQPRLHVLLGAEPHQVSVKRIPEQFGPIDTEPLRPWIASSASSESTGKLNIVIPSGDDMTDEINPLGA